MVSDKRLLLGRQGRLSAGLWWNTRLVPLGDADGDNNVEWLFGEALLDQGLHVRPLQAAQPAADLGHGDARQAPGGVVVAQVVEATGDPFQARLAAPMLLGREVEDVGLPLLAGHEQDDTRLQLPALAGRPIGLIALWKAPFERQRQPLAHNALGVDGVHQGVDIGDGEQVCILS